MSDRHTGGKHPAMLTAACTAAIAAIGMLDGVTGYDFGLSAFYLVPVMAGAYFAGGPAGILNACAAAAAWYLAERYAGHVYGSPAAIYWNTGVRLLIFALMAVTMARLRASLAIEQRQRERLTELNDLKNQFVGVAAHDLRTPLAVIRMYAEIIAEKGEGLAATQRAAFLRVIRDRADFMLRLVEELLDLSAIESGKLSLQVARQDYRRFLEEQLGMLRSLAEQKGVRVLLEGEAIPPLPFDAGKIEQVLGNLVINALKFSPPGAAIRVSVSVEGNRVVTRVTDEGPGIPDQELPQLFVPFRRSSVPPYGDDKGAGLGLTIAKQIVEAHRGEIGVTSAPGRGSTFSYALPLGG